MRSWSRLIVLLFVISAACAPTPSQVWPTDSPDTGSDSTDAPTPTAYSANWSQVERNMEAMWEGDPSLTTTVYAPGFSPSAPYAELFGSSDLAQTLQALQNAIPDLELNWRMRARENDWAAWAFELSGTFTEPLVVKDGSLPPTNSPFFAVTHMMVHADLNDQIDYEFSVADLPSMMGLLGRPLFAGEQFGDVALEMPLPAELGTDNSAISPVVGDIVASIMNSSSALFVPPDVNSFGLLPMLYHSPFGDVDGGIPEIERELLRVPGAELFSSQIVHEGNLFGAAYDYYGKPYNPLTVSNGVQLDLSSSVLEFKGVALFEVKPSGAVELWNLYDRAVLAQTMDYYGPWMTTEAQTSEAEPSVEPTSAATQPTVTGAACVLTTRGNVNLRSGPGTTFARAGALAAGASQSVIGQAKGGDGFVWWKLDSGNWVRSDLVQTSGDCAAVPTIGA